MDDIDRALIQRRQEGTGQPYAAPAASVVLETLFERPLPL